MRSFLIAALAIAGVSSQAQAADDIQAAMKADKTGTKGHSVYLRPSVGIGTDRPYDGSVEVGYKMIW